jgi:hypothetical protein
MKLILYHGTSEANAKKIMAEGFKPGKKYNWRIKSKPDFVYLSKSYGPFYAMASTKGDKMALIKVAIDSKDAYPEDDFVMFTKGKPVYTQAELDNVDFEKEKELWPASLRFMGNVAAKPGKVRILGVRYFEDRGDLIWKCDPVISPTNFMLCGKYYEDLSDWIYEGKAVKDFPSMFEGLMGMSEAKARAKLKKDVV